MFLRLSILVQAKPLAFSAPSRPDAILQSALAGKSACVGHYISSSTASARGAAIMHAQNVNCTLLHGQPPYQRFRACDSTMFENQRAETRRRRLDARLDSQAVRPTTRTFSPWLGFLTGNVGKPISRCFKVGRLCRSFVELETTR